MFVSVHEHSDKATPDKLAQTYIVCELHEKINMLWSFLKSHKKKKLLVFMQSWSVGLLSFYFGGSKWVRFLAIKLKMLQGNYSIFLFDIMPIRQKLGMILENKMSEN